MLSSELTDALNKQVNEEFYSAYIYGAMANHLEYTHLPGFAQWMRAQAEEELGHARKMINYINDRGAKVIFEQIAAPKAEWESPLAAIDDALAHERHIRECNNKLQTLALKKNDHATHAFLEWFVTEQVEEEANVDQLVHACRMVQDAPSGMFLLDRELAQRTTQNLPGGES